MTLTRIAARGICSGHQGGMRSVATGLRRERCRPRSVGIAATGTFFVVPKPHANVDNDEDSFTNSGTKLSYSPKAHRNSGRHYGLVVVHLGGRNDPDFGRGIWEFLGGTGKGGL